MRKDLTILIAENSTIISRGICAVIKHIYHNAEIFTAADTEQLKMLFSRKKPDILIINANFFGIFGIAAFKKNFAQTQTKFIALQSSFLEKTFVKEYDETISIYDSEDTVKKKIADLINDEEKEKPQDMISAREKDIVIEVVNGLTNKQIADKLCLSVHTVITHRRNIASKLQIHSAAGLTIYAISNKLFEVKN
ncbi:MAG: LuxR C-terminal-related transcriptional regulator [Prevotellaceae bacterium]|jgi:DNA-binding NarL/FixJ family response regulator|nr:LuxR C-terminal-related transcriptional regulator [Prevotellaceae bacterium]